MDALQNFIQSPAGLACAYALSFWHYGLYALAYRVGRMEPVAFRRWAIALKTLALVALAAAYLPHAFAPTWAAVAVPLLMALGFGLNAKAAQVLGLARTYYGHELMNLPYRAATAFPYSVMNHPMLAGNMLAFAAPLLNPGFREAWWPLAAMHVLANLGLWAMERWVTPLRLRARSGQLATP
jgi:hypothetical protein